MAAMSPVGPTDGSETVVSQRVHQNGATQTNFIVILQPFLFFMVQRDAHTGKRKKSTKRPRASGTENAAFTGKFNHVTV